MSAPAPAHRSIITRRLAWILAASLAGVALSALSMPPTGPAAAPRTAIGATPAAPPGPTPPASPSPGPTVPDESNYPPGTAPADKPIHRKVVRLRPHQFAVITNPKSLAATKRTTIVLYDDRVTLYIGARSRWTGYFRHRSTPTRPRSLARVATLVGTSPYPDWLSRVEPDIYLLRAALTQAPGSSLDVSSPRVTELRLLAGAHVHMSGVSAQVRFHRTVVTSWLPSGGPDTTPDIHRPFVAYQDAGSVLTVTNSQFSYLGGDVKLGYGVVWGRGSTGAALDSVFDHNFFGAYSNNAVDVEFRRCVFRDNDVYGLDPHTTSRGLIVDDNEAFGNRSHGIIFSQDVAESVITNNRSHHNGVNGIMVDLSDDNLVAGNRSWGNAGDGIVVQHSARVTVRDNVVTGNRVGVRVTGRSGQSRIERNDITGNPRGVEVYNMLGTPVAIVGNRIAGGAGMDGVALRNVRQVRLTGNRVLGFRYGILVSGLTSDVLIRRNRIAPHLRGVQVGQEPSRVALVGNTVTGARQYGLVLAGAAVSSTGDTITDSRHGIEIRGPALVRDITITRARLGIELTGDAATIIGAHVSARDVGIKVGRSAHFDLRASRLVAERPLVGSGAVGLAGNTLQTAAPPVSWLAVAGLAFLMTAVALHLRQRRSAPGCHARATRPPQGVRNAG